MEAIKERASGDMAGRRESKWSYQTGNSVYSMGFNAGQFAVALARTRGEIMSKVVGNLGFVLVFALAFVVGLCPGGSAVATNIVVVLADDLGYGDIGCYGHPTIKTPHLDRFAAEGLRLTHCYSAHPNCSPARAGLMTGRTPFRLGIYNWIPMFSPMHVRGDEITVATLLRNAGYETCHVGKWHLNGQFNRPGQPQPGDHGFDHWFSTQNNALPNHRNPNNFVRNGKDVGLTDGYSAALVAEEATRWLGERKESEKPFFLFVCFHEPHEPIATSPEFSSHYRSDDPSLPAHHGNVTQLDHGFGRILNSLDELSLRDDTFVFFTSDNGPAITGMHPHGSSGGLRDKKGAIYEGGIRVPGIVRWPGHTPAGQVSTTPVSGVDLLPTLCEIAGIGAPKDRILDGSSFLPALDGKPLAREKPLYWQFNRAKSDAKVAIREGRWKLVAGLDTADRKPGGGIPADEIDQIKVANLTDFELYDLENDPSESNDVSDAHADVLGSMTDDMSRLYLEMRSAAPRWPTWQWPRYESKQIQWPEYWLKRKRNR